MSLFGNSLEHETLKENSAKAVGELFNRRYQVKSVEPTYGGRYRVRLKDGTTKTVGVGTRMNMFGEERAFVKWVE